jgi:hypothetical protein
MQTQGMSKLAKDSSLSRMRIEPYKIWDFCISPLRPLFFKVRILNSVLFFPNFCTAWICYLNSEGVILEIWGVRMRFRGSRSTTLKTLARYNVWLREHVKKISDFNKISWVNYHFLLKTTTSRNVTNLDSAKVNRGLVHEKYVPIRLSTHQITRNL